MPFFNIPLILRIIRRRSSADISLVWVIGAWVCVMGMLPQSLKSADLVLKVFGIVNGVFFTGVFVSVLHFHPAVRRVANLQPVGRKYFTLRKVRRSLRYGADDERFFRKHFEAAKPIFADPFIAVGVVKIDQHKFLWMASQVIGIGIDKLLLALGISAAKSFAQVQSMRSSFGVEP
jgi:hypothetical protein